MVNYTVTVIFIVSFVFLNIGGKHDLVPTYFGRKHENGSYIDASIKSNWLRIVRKEKLLQSSVTSDVSLNVMPSIVQNSQYVNVSWKGIQNATCDDIIALYCPEVSHDNEYLDFFVVGESSTYAYGHGEHTVRLYNVRTNCEMRYFRRQNVSVGYQEFLAKSNIILFEGGPEKPLQIHLALTGNPTEMRVMWVSGTGK